MKDLHHVKLYQGESLDILRRPPSFLVKAGTLLICFILVCIIVISKYIFIPDIIQTELVIKRNQINFLTASHDTVIKNVVTTNSLKKGKIIATYGNDNISDILLLKNIVADLSVCDSLSEIQLQTLGIELLDKELEFAYNTYVHLYKKIRRSQDVPIKERTIRRENLSQSYNRLANLISEWEQRSTIISPFDGYLLETIYYTTSFVNKGDTLFKMIPVEEGGIQVSFKTHSKYKTILQSHMDNKMSIDGIGQNFPIQPGRIKNLQKDTIEVYININPTLLGNFFPAKNGDFVFSTQISINKQSVFDRLVSSIHGIL